MSRPVTLIVATALAAATSAYALQKPTRSEKRSGDPSKAELAQARSQYYAAQASLYSAVADAEALSKILELTDEPDVDLARSLISTINRSIQTTNSGTVKMGQAIHAIEKDEALKRTRSELDTAMRAVDDARSAADGLGLMAPHVKNVEAHLLNAMIALDKLSESVGVAALRPPGARAFAQARAEEREDSSPVRRKGSR